MKVYAIIVSKPENGELSPASVSYTAGFYHIPVIGISSRDSAFSDKVSYLIVLKLFTNMTQLSEYSCFISSNSSSIFSSSRCLGGTSQTFPVSTTCLYSRIRHWWSLSAWWAQAAQKYYFDPHSDKFTGRFQTKAQDLDVDDHEVKVGWSLWIFSKFSC